jgi:hypothetical protein
MPNKEEFFRRCKENNVPRCKAISAWKRIQNLEKYISDNWNLFTDMREYSKEEKLILRTKAAEHGNEYTPEELDDLIEVIGMVQDNMDRGI